jgi:hypothetical protein
MKEPEITYDRIVQIGFRCSEAEGAMLEEVCRAYSLRTSDMLRALIRQAYTDLNHPAKLKAPKPPGSPRKR